MSSPPSVSASPSKKKTPGLTITPIFTPAASPSYPPQPTASPSVTPTDSPVRYVKIDTFTCGQHGRITVTDRYDCITAAIFV